MGRATLFGVATTALGVMLACGGSTNTGTSRPGGTAGALGAGGASSAPECTTASDCSYPLICNKCPDDSDSCPTGASCINGRCFTNYSHECASGSGGSGSGGSPGTVMIEFSVVGAQSYCMTMACTGPTIDIKDLSGHSLFNVGAMGCDAECSTCEVLCLGACLPSGIAVTGANMAWDGGYATRSTCRGGTSCLETSYVQKGRYIAEMCATPGTLTGPDAGLWQCVASGPATCGQVEFDFPSGGVVKGQVGP
jgi:hypothetical protein